jgi:hypothetical protein
MQTMTNVVIVVGTLEKIDWAAHTMPQRNMAEPNRFSTRMCQLSITDDFVQV